MGVKPSEEKPSDTGRGDTEVNQGEGRRAEGGGRSRTEAR